MRPLLLLIMMGSTLFVSQPNFTIIPWPSTAATTNSPLSPADNYSIGLGGGGVCATILLSCYLCSHDDQGTTPLILACTALEAAALTTYFLLQRYLEWEIDIENNIILPLVPLLLFNSISLCFGVYRFSRWYRQQQLLIRQAGAAGILAA